MVIMLAKTFHLILVTFLVTLQFIHSTSTKPIFVEHRCLTENGRYAVNSTFQNNLNQVLSDLESNSSITFFHSSTFGEGSDIAYGRYYCRHDLSSKTCSSCVHAAAKQIVANCSSARQAIVWFAECTLLHKNISNAMDTDVQFPIPWPWVSWYSSTKVSNLDVFRPVLESTMDRVINASAYQVGSQGFATAEGSVNATQMVYCLGQCSPDITGLSCEDCLKKALLRTQLSCGDYDDVTFFYPSCQLWFSTLRPFYYIAPSPPPTATPSLPMIISPALPPVIVNSSTSSGPPPAGNVARARNCGYIVELGVVMVFSVLMLLVNWAGCLGSSLTHLSIINCADAHVLQFTSIFCRWCRNKVDPFVCIFSTI